MRLMANGPGEESWAVVFRTSAESVWCYWAKGYPTRDLAEAELPAVREWLASLVVPDDTSASEIALERTTREIVK